MAASNEERIESDSRRLCKYSLEEIQEAIGKALQELTGKAYSVEVRSLDRHPRGELSAGMYDVVDLNIRIKEDTGPLPF